MRTVTEPEWVGPPGEHGVLLLSATLSDQGFWWYTYSVAPGVRTVLLTLPGPGLPDPADPVYALIARGQIQELPT